MDINFHEEGVPSWVELTMPDAEVSAHFYGQLFGWTPKGGLGGRQGSRACLLCERHGGCHHLRRE